MVPSVFFLAVSQKSVCYKYIQGSAIVVETMVGFGNEGSRDKSYIPGAPTTPVKPCESAVEADALSRSSMQYSRDGFTDHQGGNDPAAHAVSRQPRMDDAEHFSAEELDSSDESSLESTGSGIAHAK
jgi:hypothetical protein